MTRSEVLSYTVSSFLHAQISKVQGPGISRNIHRIEKHRIAQYNQVTIVKNIY